MPSFVDLSRLICGLISSWSYSNLTLTDVFLLGYLIFLIQFGNFFGLRNWIAWCFLGNCSPCCRFQEINQKPSLFFFNFSTWSSNLVLPLSAKSLQQIFVAFWIVAVLFVRRLCIDESHSVIQLHDIYLSNQPFKSTSVIVSELCKLVWLISVISGRYYYRSGNIHY